MAMVKVTLVDAINRALHQEMERDEKVIVMGEDVGKDGGVFRVTEGLYAKFGENRVIDTPLAESGIVGTAIGLAVSGLRPVAEVQFDGFVYPAFDQLISHAARIRNRSRGRFHCPLVLRMPYGGGIKALEHHSEAMEALFVHLPGCKVVIPSNPYDAKGLMASAIREEDPVIFLEPKKLYRAFKQEIPEEAYTVPLGEAKIVREGTDVTVVSYGNMARVSNDAAELAQEQGISAEVIDLRTVSPLDKKTVIESVKKTGRVVVVHEAPRSCGVGAELVATIARRALLELKAPMERITGFDIITPYARLEDYYLPNPKRVLNAIKRTMGDF